MGRRTQVRCHGDDKRFDAVVALVRDSFGPEVRYVADAAGGQGVLSRMLAKQLNLTTEVIDPRAHVLKGVSHRQAEFRAEDATYYDLVIGLHPDAALVEVAKAALVRPAVIIPCCNFWSKEKLGLKELIEAMSRWFDSNAVDFELETLDFKGPYNRAFVTRPGR